MKTQENKNIKLINKWCNAWELPGGSYLDMLNCFISKSGLVSLLILYINLILI